MQSPKLSFGENEVMRKTIFANDECYHIYNRGVDKREVFSCAEDYERFLLSMREFNDENLTVSLRDVCLQKLSFGDYPRSLASGKKPLVEIICYCLNPNHYHFILKQLINKGIEKFMQRLGTGYTKYFNTKRDRSGSLFQGPFKAIHIDSNEYLLHLSAYVNKNNFIHGYSKDDLWPYSSFLDYIGKRNDELCEKDIVLGQFRNEKEYKEFADANAEYMKDKKDLERYLLE
ncbi:MAG: transposase [bacterium]|nr:transposase [bacterium]